MTLLLCLMDGMTGWIFFGKRQRNAVEVNTLELGLQRNEIELVK